MAGFDPKAQIGDNSPTVAGVAELADAMDSKSILVHPKCGFESHLRYLKKLAATIMLLRVYFYGLLNVVDFYSLKLSVIDLISMIWSM